MIRNINKPETDLKLLNQFKFFLSRDIPNIVVEAKNRPIGPLIKNEKAKLDQKPNTYIKLVEF
tara:strand:- start:60 stop:248 length:189 start_codon:yes stop_codon:yes gene_type:complete